MTKNYKVVKSFENQWKTQSSETQEPRKPRESEETKEKTKETREFSKELKRYENN